MQLLLHWKSNEHYTICVCIYSLTYLACNAHAQYCRLWPAPLKIFPHYLINGTIKKKLWNTKCVFLFSLQIFTETFFIFRRIERDMIKKFIVLHVKFTLFLFDCNET